MLRYIKTPVVVERLQFVLLAILEICSQSAESITVQKNNQEKLPFRQSSILEESHDACWLPLLYPTTIHAIIILQTTTICIRPCRHRGAASCPPFWRSADRNSSHVRFSLQPCPPIGGPWALAIASSFSVRLPPSYLHNYIPLFKNHRMHSLKLSWGAVKRTSPSHVLYEALSRTLISELRQPDFIPPDNFRTK